MNVKRMFWVAYQSDGKVLREKDGNDFNEIDREKLNRFVLEGMNSKFSHNILTGQMEIDNKDILMFLLNDKLIGKSADVINYKEKLKFAMGESGLDDAYVGYYTGWKEKNEDFDMIENLIWIDMVEKSVKVRLRLTPKTQKALEKCEFVLCINGRMIIQELELKEIGKREEFVFNLM